MAWSFSLWIVGVRGISCLEGVDRIFGRFGFACARAYGSKVVAFGDGFIPGTEVPGFHLEALSRLFWF